MTKKLTTRRAALFAAVVGCTALAVVGIGAMTSLETSVENNKVTIAGADRSPTPDPTPTPEPTPFAKLVTSSQPFDATFRAAGESFRHDFTIKNDGNNYGVLNNRDTVATWDASFTNIALSHPELAPHIRIEYGARVPDGNIARWAAGGTIESPESYVTALKRLASIGVPTPGSLGVAQQHTVTVRFTIDVDPAEYGATESNPGTLTLDWTASYTYPGQTE